MKSKLVILAVVVLAILFVASVSYMQAKNTNPATTTVSEDKSCPKDGAKCCPAKDECKTAKGECKNAKDECKDPKAGCCDKAKETKKSCPGTACKGSACEKSCPMHGNK